MFTFMTYFRMKTLKISETNIMLVKLIFLPLLKLHVYIIEMKALSILTFLT